ncbi:MAG TPA: thiamine-phosphate kinase [Burkholderiales bacterium]
MKSQNAAPALSEFELIAKFFTRPVRHTVLGVGDDAALVKVNPGWELVASTDMMVEGVHFFADADAHALGHKLLAVNLSDLAAMGAIPKWAMLAIALPAADSSWVERFANGFFTLAERHDVDLIGGDTTRGPRNLCVQIMGEVEAGKALRRDGAKPGDDVWVSGHLGDAAAAVAHRKGGLQLRGTVLAHCMERLDKPVPRVELGRGLIGMAHAAIDISDGLVADLGHICAQSGVGAQIAFDSIPCSPELMSLRGYEPVVRALLAGGDDYELCFTAPRGQRGNIDALSGKLGLPLNLVGTIVPGTDVQVRDGQGRAMTLEATGFDHFR